MSLSPKNRRTQEFKRQFDRLPEKMRRLAVEAFRAFRRNPAHPSLALHDLKDNHRGRHREGSRSVRISMKYRAIFAEEAGFNVWYWVGTHNDYEAFTGEK